MEDVLVNKRLCCVLVAMMAIPAVMLGQDKAPAASAPPANPITISEKGVYSFISGAVVKAAEKMPEENYSYKPTPDVRTFGQLVGHIADAQFSFCGLAAGEQPSTKSIEATKTSKTD